MKLVVDACVFVAEQIEEQPEFADAERFLDYCVRTGVAMYAPAIVMAEVSGAVARITGDTALGGAAVTRLRHFPRLVFRQIDLDFAEAAARLAARCQMRGADAHYVALAKELRCVVISDDKELLQRCPAAVKAMTPASWLNARLRTA